METYSTTEIAVGGFVIAGATALAFLSFSIAGLNIFEAEGLSLQARFASVGDLKSGAVVKMAGVKVGSVKSIRLENYAAEVTLSVDPQLQLPSDTIASIRTAGLLGDSYVLLRPGGSEKNLKPNDRIAQTEPAIDLIDLVVKYALEKDNEDGGGSDLDDPLEEL